MPRKLMTSLRGKVAVVTGAGSGIGRGIAVRLARGGVRVAVTDLSFPAAAETVRMIEGRRGGDRQCMPIEVDVRDPAQVRAGFHALVDRWERIDVLVNNAGVNVAGDIRGIDDASWARVIGTNLAGPFHCTREALPYMPVGSVVVNVASPHGVRAGETVTAYATSKAGLLGLTRSCAIDLAHSGIRVVAVLPGTIDTPLVWAGYPRDEWSIRRKIIQLVHPIGRLGTPDDVAALVVYLVSSDASFITGSAIAVDGGLLAALF